jgi:hypothetical protein
VLRRRPVAVRCALWNPGAVPVLFLCGTIAVRRASSARVIVDLLLGEPQCRAGIVFTYWGAVGLKVSAVSVLLPHRHLMGGPNSEFRGHCAVHMTDKTIYQPRVNLQQKLNHAFATKNLFNVSVFASSLVLAPNPVSHTLGSSNICENVFVTIMSLSLFILLISLLLSMLFVGNFVFFVLVNKLILHDY